jgi:hypothetical protein
MATLERIYKNDLLKDVSVVRNGWKALFDPSTTEDSRKEIKRLLREFIEEGALLKPASVQSQYYFFGKAQPHEPEKSLYMSALPPGYMQLSGQTQIIGVMNRGFYYAGYFNPILKEIGLAKQPPILAGYSSGMYNRGESKTFSDGTSMCGKVFILKEDLEKALSSPEMVFIDDYIDTGTTMSAIGNAFRQQGYSGKMYTLDENSSIHVWSGWIRGRPSVEVPQIIPVVTEMGEEAGPLCEAAKLAVRK